jgi:hypothetical protein
MAYKEKNRRVLRPGGVKRKGLSFPKGKRVRYQRAGHKKTAGSCDQTV